MQIGSLKEASRLIEKYDSIVIFHHIRPDGDCLGSQFGLKELLNINFPNKKVYAIGDTKGSFKFLNLEHDAMPSPEILSKSLAIIVDANFKDRIECRELLDSEIFPETLRIDHHPNDDDLYNCTRWVDSSYIAADEMVTELAFENNWKVTPKAASYLYLGINTDSGRFLFDKTSARTFKLVAFLYDNGLNADFIHRNLAAVTLEDLKYNAWLMSTLKTRDGVAYIQNDLENTYRFNKTPQSSIRVNSIANIIGYPIWVQFTEEEDKRVRVEFRSNGPIVRNIALKWGGGGHERASGAMISSLDLVEQVIDDCALEVQNYLNEQK
ncbi:DHH family phosphoesterase [Mycoplasmopsis pullorum]|uniref:DHH family phosphoesterase n=1 Tax=Mycoplasmopsis pullorum TaxID=48003 RepID=UPI001117B8F7|nr:bifunctional oligoribonuclease/PAP phosphatase NrnA [Mycoplasmopsis pullorum]TNK82595.1 DHH family phosphoesterase [Mycoplasmopsis pullorum]TNK83494.1 DHH family phosphoesterase [Mycoplasmopsis pullorum]TNK84709.1 DHH family phosphoesterase [Mycoplasmopsis pullorum]TNK85740.1 DHH family phosphoesterase [Mycoplasmopsis pullorum]TNK86281.1 DHH family phosphoesterase [Mycoplasmopsis pullorum]